MKTIIISDIKGAHESIIPYAPPRLLKEERNFPMTKHWKGTNTRQKRHWPTC
ncbi:MAG: hypothetical protein P8100_08705 [bacterium]